MDEMTLKAKEINQQAGILIKSGKIEKAKEKLEEAIDLDPMLRESYEHYGELYMHTGQYQKAKDYFKKALMINKTGELYFAYGNACFMNDELEDGIKNYNLAISEGFDSDEMMFFMGMAYEHMQDDRMALRYFTKAYLKNPARPDYLVKKIELLLKMGELEEAEKCIDKLISSAPELFDGYHLKTNLLIHNNKVRDAVIFSKTASEKFPEDVELLFDYARALTLEKDFESAYKVIDRAKKMKYFEEEKRDFIYLEAQITAEKNNIPQAIQYCNECIELEEGNYFDEEVRYMLMNLYLEQKDYCNSFKIADEIVKNNHENIFYFAALYYRPFSQKKICNDDETKKMYKDAISIYRIKSLETPSSLDLYIYRAMCLKDLEEYDDALELTDFLLEVNDSIAEVYILRAQIYKEKGDKVAEKNQMEKAYKIKPELKTVYSGGE